MDSQLMRRSCLAMVICGLAIVFSSPVRADDGGALFKSKCVVCHGADGKGTTPAAKAMGAPDFTSSEVQGKTDAQLTEITAKGKGKMPGYEKSLSEAQIKSLVAYIRELGKKK